jgi:hypothetical protein
MGDVQMAFGILIRCFMQHSSYLLQCPFASSTLIESLISFDSPLYKRFGCLLGPRSFDIFKGPLSRKQASLPINFGGVGVISTSTIAPTTYFRSWALVTLIIVARFMVDGHPFLLETLT